MNYHYKAFISYKHDPVDSEIAAEIQNRLERFPIPYALRKEKGIRNLRPVFRDKEELSATEDLNDMIKAALMDTEYLIVICSTRSIKSIWVKKEIEFFLEHHDQSKVLTVLVDGEPEEVIPPVLYEKKVTTVDENGNTITVTEAMEPLSCDYRIDRRRARKEEFPRLAAALIGCRYNDLRNRQRQYQMRLMGAGLAILSLLMVYFIWSNLRISENLRQSQISRSRNLANLSAASLEENDRLMAVRFALEALPDEENDRPVIYEAALALSRAEGAYNFPDTLDVEENAQLPARYTLNAFKVTSDGRYLAMLDGYYLLRFFDQQTKEEIGQAELEKAVTLLTIMGEDTLLVAGEGRLSAVSMRTAEVLWTQDFEKSIQGMCVIEKEVNDARTFLIALVFPDCVLAVGADRQEILGRFDAGSEEIPFCFRTDHPYTYAKYPYGEDENGHSLYYDEENRLLYVISRTGTSYTDTNINGVLVLDVQTLTASFHPIGIECAAQFAIAADETGLYLICERQDEEYGLNTVFTGESRRTNGTMTGERWLTVLKADLGGKILWEERVPFTGTNMLGNTSLVLFQEESSENTAKDDRCLGAMFSNRFLCMDPQEGRILNEFSLQSEIIDATISKGQDNFFVFMLDGSFCSIAPAGKLTSAYNSFIENICRASIRSPEMYDQRMTVYLQRSDGVWIYTVEEGDEEYTAYLGKCGENYLVNECLSGQEHYVCGIANEEIAVLDLLNNTADVKPIGDFGLTQKKGLLYMDPEDRFFIVYGRNEEGIVLKKIFLKDLTCEGITGPAMKSDDNAYSYMAEPVCAGEKILYFALKNTGTKDPFCLCIYDIPADTWTVHRLDFSMLNLLLPFSVSQDGGTVLTEDQYENGYLIRTKDAAVTALPEKIPAWEECCWNAEGTAFALRIADAEREQIVSFSTSGRELFRTGREYISPISMTYHDNSLWVLFEDHLVCEYDAKNGALRSSISAATSWNILDKNFHWDFTKDGQLIINMGNTLAQIDLKLGGMTAEVRQGAGYIASLDRMLVINEERSDDDDRVFVSYPRYTVDDMIRKGNELAEGLELTEEQKRKYALE